MPTISNFILSEKGMIFSIDAFIAFVILLFSVLLFVLFLNNFSSGAASTVSDFELEEKSLLIADSFVKNYSSENSLLGACILDMDKKRVLLNQLSFENLSKIKPFSQDRIFVKSISYSLLPSPSFSVIILDSSKSFSSCVSAKRFVLIDNQKAIVEVLVCREN